MAAPQASKLEEKVCEIRLDDTLHTIYLSADLDHCRFSESRRVMSFEPLRNEWIEIHGTLLFDEQHPSAADRGLTGRHKSQMRIGSLVAWYYPESHTLTLWGLTGIKGIRETQGNAPFTPDDNVTAVWQGIERAMQRQFPDLRIIVAPTAPFTLPAENKAWNRFLEAHDYRVDADNGERAIRTV